MSSGFSVKDNGNNKILVQNSLRLNMRLEIAGANIAIQELNMDANVVKSRDEEPNKTTITLWNISDSTYNRITEKAYAMDLYVWYGNDEPALMFRGDLHDKRKGTYSGKKNTAKGFLESPFKQDIRGGYDIPTEIELVERKTSYVDAKIDKNYRAKVSTTQIIYDCAEAMGTTISYFSKNIVEKFYPTYCAKGKPNVIMTKILKAIGGKWTIQNGLIQVYSIFEKSQGTYAVLLNGTNSMKPSKESDENVVISTRLIPFLTPSHWVSADFDEVSGLYLPNDVISELNNYGTKGSTDVVIKCPKPKQKKNKTKKKKVNDESL